MDVTISIWHSDPIEVIEQSDEVPVKIGTTGNLALTPGCQTELCGSLVCGVLRMLRSILAFLVQGLWADQLSIGAEPSVAAIQPAPVASGGASDSPTPSSGIECLAVRPAGVSAPDRQPLSCAARQAEDAVVQLTAGIAAKSNPFWTGTGIAGFLNAPRLTRQTAAEPIHAEDVLAAGDSHAGQVPATAGTGLTELESTVVPGIVPRTSKDRAAEAAALLLCIIAATEPAPPAVANLLVSAAVRQEEGQPGAFPGSGTSA